MASAQTAIHVFIASPGGLQDERRAFKEVIDRVNHDHAHAVGISFTPRGWEYASSGVGRPQSKINEHVRECDYLVVILWDRWGMPPGGGQYSSGTEEEYRVALECLQDPDRPMRDIIVLFKGVQERQLADPGEDLKKVLAFKTELEENRVLLYSTFDNLDEFRDDFRQHLHGWVREWQGDQPPSKKEPGTDGIHTSAKSKPPEEDDHGLSLAQRAKGAVDRGRFTQAEQLFARSMTGPYDSESYTEYVRYLRKRGRLSLAQVTARTFLERAQDADDHSGEVEALANLAILERQQGRNLSSVEYLDRALRASDEYIESLSLKEDEDAKHAALATKAFLLDNKSLSLRRLPDRTEDALHALQLAKAVQDEVGDRRGAGFTLRNHGSLLLRLGRLDQAKQSLEYSLKVFEEIDYANGQATALGSLGELYDAIGDHKLAVEMLDRAIAVSPNRIPSRIAMNHAILARVHVKLKDFDRARDYADECLRAAHELGTPESLATALHASAQVSLAEGDTAVAEQELKDALEQFRLVDNPVGITAVLLDLARLTIRSGAPERAVQSLAESAALLEKAPHFGLQQELDAVRVEFDASAATA